MSAGAGSRRLARMQSASVAVTATVAALLATVGVAAFAVRTDGDAPRGAHVATAISNTPSAAQQADGAAGDVAAGASTDGGQAAPANPGGDVVQGGQAHGQVPEAGVGEAPSWPSNEGATGVGATGGRRAADEETTKIPIRAAEAGEWRATVTVHEDGALLDGDGGTAQASVVVEDVDADEQRIASDAPGLSVRAEKVRHDDAGRWLHRLEVAPGRDEALAFESARGHLLVPVSIRPGATWTWKAETTDRRTSLDAMVRTVGMRRVDHGGAAREVVEYDVVLRLGGDRSITIERRVWHSIELGVPIRIEERTTGTNADGQSIQRAVVLEVVGDAPAARPAPSSTTTTSSTTSTTVRSRPSSGGS